MTSQHARRVLHGTVALAGLATLTACSIPMYKLGVKSCPTARVASADKVVVQYLGVGGVLITHGDDVVLTAPLYSNPNLLEFLMDHEVRTDTALVDKLLPAGAAKAKAIVVGHSHYDHLMDVPYVALHGAKGAKIYGSETTRHLLAEILPDLKKVGSDVVALDGQAHDPHRQQGEWVDVSPTIRLMAILSEHSDQTAANLLGVSLPFHFGRGKVDKDRSELPRTTSQWAEGTVFSYVIDFRDPSGKKTVFRIYYQDSGANKDIGYLPDHVKRDGKAVDLAILCVGGVFDRLTRHPEGILEDTRPRFALLTHWEDFFVTQPAYCVNGDSGVPGIPSPTAKFLGRWRKSDTERFMDRVEQTVQKTGTEAWWLPCPTKSRFELPLAGDPSKVEPKYDAPLCPLP